MRSATFAAASFGAVLGGVGRNDDDPARHAIQIVLTRNRRIGGPHFDGRVQCNELLAHEVVHLVNVAGNQVAERMAFDDAFESFDDPDTHVLSMIRKLGTP